MSLTRRSLLGALAALVSAPAAAIAAKDSAPKFPFKAISATKEASDAALRETFAAMRAWERRALAEASRAGIRPVSIDGRRYYLAIDRVGLRKILEE